MLVFLSSLFICSSSTPQSDPSSTGMKPSERQAGPRDASRIQIRLKPELLCSHARPLKEYRLMAKTSAVAWQRSEPQMRWRHHHPEFFPGFQFFYFLFSFFPFSLVSSSAETSQLVLPGTTLCKLCTFSTASGCTAD